MILINEFFDWLRENWKGIVKQSTGLTNYFIENGKWIDNIYLTSRLGYRLVEHLGFHTHTLLVIDYLSHINKWEFTLFIGTNKQLTQDISKLEWHGRQLDLRLEQAIFGAEKVVIYLPNDFKTVDELFDYICSMKELFGMIFF